MVYVVLRKFDPEEETSFIKKKLASNNVRIHILLIGHVAAFILFSCSWVKFVFAASNGQLDVQMHLLWIIFSTEQQLDLKCSTL